MSKLGFVVLLLTNILLLQAMAHESEAEAPFPEININHSEHKTQNEVQLHDHDIVEDHKVSGATSDSASDDNGESYSKVAEAPNIRRMGKHHSTDKSVAGGGVIIGGLVTAIFAAVFSYIRVTRKRDRDTGY
ncbi:unnamed protein product [Vicia faba]|uniref:Transmembrane protein n=1 Tax=Vicia faba TaxID=3906 RepID=A0AAV1B0E8_VICFA|nr:unnamed protein product [Vicia faba]